MSTGTIKNTSVRNAGTSKSSTPTEPPRTEHSQLALVREFRKELVKAKLDKDWNAVEVFAWLDKKEAEYE